MESLHFQEKQYCGNLGKEQDLGFAYLSLTSYRGHEQLSRHYHENAYLSLLVSGSYSETNAQGKTILVPGQTIFRPALYDHANIFGGKNGLCFNIEFNKDLAEMLDFKFRLPSRNICYRRGRFASIFKAYFSFSEIYGKEGLEMLLYDWLFEINSITMPESKIVWVEKAKAILDNEVEINHTLASIADRVHVHPVYLAGCFKKKTGFTIGEYQMRAKLESACRALYQSTDSISKISFDNGFHDSAHLIRRFSNFYGVSPLQFRKKLVYRSMKGF